jgi:cystathionine beta-lyase
MGKYNFDKVIDRRGTDCLKYDFGMKRKGRNDLLPLWVADMDFKLPDVILDEFHKRIDHGIFGYTDPLDDYFDAMNHWFSTRYGYIIEPEWVTLGAGIVYALGTSVKAFTNEDDAIMVMQPVYYPFSEVIKNNRRRLVNCQLHYEDAKYTIDFESMEKSIKEEGIKALIFCNPHNPVGRVWTKEELNKVAEICMKYNVIMMVDEMHCDFIFPGHHFTSCMNLDKKYRDITALYISPGKTFNVAGLQPANIIIPNEELRKKYQWANTQAAYSQGSLMGQLAVKICYTKGAEWVNELVEYIYGNVKYMQKFIKENFPLAKFIEPEGTYLVWVDFSGYGFTNDELEHIMLEEAKLWLDSGRIFGPETAQFERFNVACPRVIVEQAMNQLKAAMDKHLDNK